MRKMTSFFFLVFIMLVGCTTRPEPTPQVQVETEEVPYTIGLIMKTLTNPFFVEMERGARDAEKAFDVRLLVRTAAQETSIEQQIEIVNQLVQEDVDAIVIAPGDSVQLIPALKRAQDAGIVVVNIDNLLDPQASEENGLVNVPFISVDNDEGAYLSAKFISDQITEPTNVIVLEGIRTAKNAQDRKSGALRAFEENENITIVAEETANWKIDEGYTVTQQIFEENSDIGAVFAANDMMALGAIQYLAETENDDVLVAAYDALSEAKDAIRNGQLDATIDQRARDQGYLGVEYAVRALNGEELPAVTLIDVDLITIDTLDDES